jgi:DNA-binding NarL/FixJ family response regulator
MATQPRARVIAATLDPAQRQAFATLPSRTIMILLSQYKSIVWVGEISLPMKFLLVDDHALIREAVRGVLSELDDGATILEASRWRDASRLLGEHSDLSLVLLDLGLPDRDGFAALEEMRAHHPKIPIVILSASCGRDNVVKALNLGAVGFIPKSGEREVMLSALRLVFSGGVYIPPEILSHSEVPSGLGPSLTSGRSLEGPAPASPADLGLTSRQVDVLALMMRGKSNKAICRILDLAEPTVKNHVTAILKALKVSNRTEAVIMVGGLGWELPRFDS